MSKLDEARVVITTGQSGNPFDRQYGDMVETWASGGTYPLPFSPTQSRTRPPPPRRRGPERTVYSFTGSGPSGTSIWILPSSTTTS